MKEAMTLAGQLGSLFLAAVVWYSVALVLLISLK